MRSKISTKMEMVQVLNTGQAYHHKHQATVLYCLFGQTASDLILAEQGMGASRCRPSWLCLCWCALSFKLRYVWPNFHAYLATPCLPIYS